jgi:hypothetical protein
MTGRGEGASHTLSCLFRVRAQISEFRQTGMADEFRNPFNYNVGKVALLTPPVFLPTGNSLVSYVWQRGPAQAQRSIAVEGPGRGIPRVVVTCTWRGCARESVSRFEVLRVNPWILFASRLGNCSAQCNLRLSHAKLPVYMNIVIANGNDRASLAVAIRYGSSI